MKERVENIWNPWLHSKQDELLLLLLQLHPSNYVVVSIIYSPRVTFSINVRNCRRAIELAIFQMYPWRPLNRSTSKRGGKIDTRIRSSVLRNRAWFYDVKWRLGNEAVLTLGCLFMDFCLIFLCVELKWITTILCVVDLLYIQVHFLQTLEQAGFFLSRERLDTSQEETWHESSRYLKLHALYELWKGDNGVRWFCSTN